jgi:hypothetical protein
MTKTTQLLLHLDQHGHLPPRRARVHARQGRSCGKKKKRFFAHHFLKTGGGEECEDGKLWSKKTPFLPPNKKNENK